MKCIAIRRPLSQFHVFFMRYRYFVHLKLWEIYFVYILNCLVSEISSL